MLFAPRLLWVGEPASQKWQIERIRFAQDLFPRLLSALDRIIAKGTAMSNAAIARELGLAAQERELQGLWETHPQLGPVIKRYRRVMSHRYADLVRLRRRKNRHARAVVREETRLELFVERRMSRTKPPSTRALNHALAR
jgi:hypothetical protein